MNKIIKLSLIVLAFGLVAMAQTKVETIDFIIKEFRVFERDEHIIKNISFSEDGSVFNFKSYVPPKPERKLTIPLKEVDIYTIWQLGANGTRRYSLVVESKGRAGRFQVNDRNVFGVRTILKDARNPQRLEALAKAFAHLTMLDTKSGKPLF